MEIECSNASDCHKKRKSKFTLTQSVEKLNCDLKDILYNLGSSFSEILCRLKQVEDLNKEICGKLDNLPTNKCQEMETLEVPEKTSDVVLE